MHLKNVIDDEIKELLENDVIQESVSPYNSPMVVVPKKKGPDGREKFRVCFDYRKLNEVTIEDVFPMPNLENILNSIKGVKYYSVLDMSKGFHQLLLNPRDRHKTSFSTEDMKYEFKRMPFGVRGGPSSFQRMMNKVLKGLKNVLIFMDDVLIFSDTIEAHIELFNEVMRRLKEVNLLVQIEKCELLKSEVCYLGFIVNKDGVKPNPEKIRVVKEFPRPKNVKNIRQFIGLCSFYRKHIKNFAKVSKPLTKLLDKNNKFQ